MKEYVLLFRMDILNKAAQPSEEQMNIYMQQWTQWVNSIAAKLQLADGGNHFSREGRVLKAKGEVINTPHISENNSVAGYIIILAKNIDEATSIAQQCPILQGENTSVEIRETAAPGP